MIFKKSVFKCVSKELLYKTQMNGLNDPTLSEFWPVSVGSAIKPEFRESFTEREYIQSYLKGSKAILEKLLKEESGKHIKALFKDHSLTLTIFYLCRHCTELSIKHATPKSTKKRKAQHSLISLWSALLEYVNLERCSDEEKVILNNMAQFINFIDEIDDNGNRLRYATQLNGTDSQKSFIWANPIVLINQTESFVDQLELLAIIK